MKLTLIKDGKSKTYTSGTIMMRSLRDFSEFLTRADMDNLSVDELDEIFNQMCKVFNNQFNIDDLYDGLAVEKFASTFLEFHNTVMGVAGEPAKETGKKPSPQQKTIEE
ncbi:phage tail assembly chaperone G [Peribacillus kribbensis]|uniref:phage tail assembly chaperone G n=1 Tax=Peribacillus kribbensis TaxID=356658 RepID=UPI0004037FB5|nr:hypothetical protein [Peribacillus kribbensis]